MRHLTLGQIKPDVAEALGECTTSTLVVRRINQSQERLLNRPTDPLGSTVRYRFCVNEACIVFPRQVRTVLRWALCACPGVIRPEWHELLQNGPGVQDEDGCLGNTLIDHGTTPVFKQVDGTGKYVRLYAHDAADAGKKVILRYYRDDTHTKKYSTYGGVVQEGEEITLVAPPAYALTTSTVMKGGLYAVIKPATSHPLSLYEYNGTANTAHLAWYEPSETTPIYREYLVPGLADHGGCGDTDCAGTACDMPVITALVRLQHVPVALDNDPLVIGNPAAITLASMAIQAELQHRRADSRDLWAMAREELEGELAAYQGSGMTVTIHAADRDIWGGGGVCNVL